MTTLMDLLGIQRPDTMAGARAILDQVRREHVSYYPSPTDWRDEVLYFLLPDRFSDAQESNRSLLTRNEIINLRNTSNRVDWNWQAWAESGKRWQGGTIKGVHSKLTYLNDLGVSAIWVGPVFKQRARLDSYHGYGIQDFLDVDPRFGTRADLLELVGAAHNLSMRIILDVIVNHSGDNWGYVPPQGMPEHTQNEPPFRDWPNYYGNPHDPDLNNWSLAWRDEHQQGFTQVGADITQLHEGIWPREMQSSKLYTRAGMGDLGAGDIRDAHAEHKRTDFFALKDFALDSAETLQFLTDVYKYWIALTDCDGFRIDTVKHMSLQETRNFCGGIREFSESISKRNFLLVGEIAGGDYFQDYVLDNLAVLQRNLSSALDIGSARTNLNNVAKGLSPAGDYLNGFKESSNGFESHRQFGDRHISILDDHDHVFGKKIRFSAEIPDNSPVKDYQVVTATAFQLFTLGIPCIYYGTEQALSGPAQNQLQYLAGEGWNNPGDHGDRYLRESMFGPAHPRASHDASLETQLANDDSGLPGFGPFGTAGKHCFDENSPAYVRISHLCTSRKEHLTLRVGRQYARKIRVFGAFEYPGAGELVAWSRILDNQEAVCIVNPNGLSKRGGDVQVSSELLNAGDALTVVANTEHFANGSNYPGPQPINSTIEVKGGENGAPLYVEMRDVEPAEVIILLKQF